MGTGAEAASLSLPSRPFASSGKETHERSLVAVARVISFIRMRTLSHQFFPRSFCQGMRAHTKESP